MIQSVLKFIEKENLLAADDKILLAVSGGIDSMVMLNIFYQLNFQCSVAHLNHGLRGKESDTDQDFVEQVCKKLSLDFHCKNLDIKELSLIAKSNLSEEGRKQRYAYFNEVMDKNGYTILATAHHADDQIETFIMRSIYGSGLKGLSSIPVKNKQIIRPLIYCTKSDIIEYAESKQIEYREDSSNLKTDYLRNAIRHELIPIYEKLDPNYSKGLLKSIDNIKDSEQLLRTLSTDYLKGFINKKKDEIHIDKSAFKIDGNNTLLYYSISAYGFNRNQVNDILGVHAPGAYFYSKTHRLLVDREVFIISDLKTENFVDKVLIQGYGEYPIGSKYKLTIKSLTKVTELDENEELIDLKKVSFPMHIRKWRDGDRFKPLGMNGQSQSVQDYLTNNKISRNEKEKTYVLESSGQIIWLIGHRISDIVKQDEQTESYILLQWTTLN